MKAIDFVVRGSAGGMQRGTVAEDAQNQVIEAGSGQEISINARQSDFASQVRSGDNLVMTLADGRTITINNFFNDSGTANRLFVSADGYLNEVSFVDQGQGNLYAQYGPTSEWGKWSPSEELIFLGNSDVAGMPLGDGEEVSMLGATLLGGGGLFGGGAAIAAGVGGAAAVIGGVGGGGGGGEGPAAPYVNDGDANVVVGGDEGEEVLVITGGGEPGHTVTVVVGEETVETVIDENGEFEAVFEGEDFPEDGVYDAVVTVTDPEGTPTELDGPSFEIDTTAPEITFTEGTESTGDFFNEVSFAEGVTLTGSGEAGATLAVTIAGITQTTVVSDEGTWSVSWAAGTLEAGEYTTGITAVTSDSFGNTRSYSDTLVVDTVTTVTVNTADIGGDGTINGAEHDEGVTFRGTAQAGSTVEVTVGDVTQTVTANAQGRWSSNFSTAKLEAGEYEGTVSVKSTDTHGNVATTSGTYQVDTLVRDFEITSSTGGSDGVITSDEVGAALTVSGTTEPGSSVVVSLGDASATAVVAEDGSWTATFAAGSVAEGTYTATMTATATDLAGNVDTATTSVQVDTEAGLLTIDSDPVEGDDIVNQAEASDGVMLTGTADPGASVNVTMAGVSHTVTTDADGNWEAFFAASEVAAGVYTAEITATTADEFGQGRSATDSVQVDTRVDNLAVNAGSIAGDNIISALEHDGNVTVTGTTEAGSSAVMITMGGVTVPATITSAGNWSAVFSADVLETGTYTADISVSGTDRAGNTKVISATVDVDTEVSRFAMTENSAGSDQTVNFVEASAGIDLGGTVEAGSTVRVTFDGTQYDATVDRSGNWSVTVPAGDVRAGEYDADISVRATDHVGNVATITDTLAIDTSSPLGPVIASHTAQGDGTRGISIETVMEGGAPSSDVQTVSEVTADGDISGVSSQQSFDSGRGETNFSFNDNVPNGSNLIVNSTDDAGNTTGTYMVLNDGAETGAVDLSNVALGEYQIENLDLDFAEAAHVVVDEASLLALSTNSNTLTIHGSAEDHVTIQDATARGVQTVDGQRFNVYSVGDEGTLLVDQDIPVTI